MKDWIPRNWSNCEPPCRGWESNVGPLQEQVLLAAEPAITLAPILCFLNEFWQDMIMSDFLLHDSCEVRVRNLDILLVAFPAINLVSVCHCFPWTVELERPCVGSRCKKLGKTTLWQRHPASFVDEQLLYLWSSYCEPAIVRLPRPQPVSRSAKLHIVPIYMVLSVLFLSVSCRKS